MNLQSTQELQKTREKLLGLEKLYQETATRPTENEYAKELTLRSLRQTINQLKEEIARFAARAGSVSRDE